MPMSEPKGDQDGEKSGLVPMVLATVVLVIGIVIMFTFLGVIWDAGDVAGERICTEEYGQDATYIGDTGFGSSTGICETDGEQRYIDINTTGSDYWVALTQLFGGDGDE